MKYQPLGRRLIVRVITKQEVEVAGLKLALAKGKNHKEWSEKVLWAEVLRVGVDFKDDEPIVVGDVVLIGGDSGKWIDKDLHEGQDTHRIVYDDEVLAIDESMSPRFNRVQEVLHA